MPVVPLYSNAGQRSVVVAGACASKVPPSLLYPKNQLD